MSSRSRFYLAFNRMNQVGPQTVRKLLSRWPDLADLFALSQDELQRAGLPEALATQIAHFDWSLVDKDFAWEAIKSDHHLITLDSPDYPHLLAEIASPPLVLYVIGQKDALSRPAIAMVGTRNPSPAGADNAFHFARELSRQGLVIVSGLALGVDAKAHQGCLQADGQTLAVMGTGIDRIYPQRHQQLADAIKGKGAIISEFPLQSPPIAGHFPRRNRIISGLSLATLVVEAAIQSGSLITARLAVEQNREVLAIPGSINNPMARGCHHLLQQGAKLVTKVDDVLEEIRFSINKPMVAAAETLEKKQLDLASRDKMLVKFIDYDLTTVDQIMTRSGESIDAVMGRLIELELAGVVKAMPGGYIRC